MARKIIDIGIVGNDGTGDSIRDSFRKVNDNFRELYSSLGLGERLSFIGLNDTPDAFSGYDPVTGNTPLVTINDTESGLAFKSLIPGNGISIDFTTNPNEIVINSEFSNISADPSPQLGGDLSLRSGGQQYRILDSGTDISPLLPIYKHELVNKAYADTKVSKAGVEAINPETGTVDPSMGRMTGPLVLSRDPEPDDDVNYDGLVAATKRYVDNSAFGSSVNLYVALSGQDDRVGVSKDLQGRALAYAYRTLEAALKRAEELVLEAPVELGPYKKVLTYNNHASECTLSSIETSPDSGTGFSGIVRMSVDTVTLVSVGTNYYPGDILEIQGGTLPEGGGRCYIQVLTTLTTPGAILGYKIISTGSYLTLPGSSNISTTITTSAAPAEVGAIGSGATFNVTYKVNSVQIVNGGSDYSLVSVRISGGGGSGAFGEAVVNSGAVSSITITNKGSGFTSLPSLSVDLPRFLIYTNGYRTDYTGDYSTDTPQAIRGRDIRAGLYLRGETSGALAEILSHPGDLDSEGNEIFDVDIKSGSFILGEVISYGDIAKNIQISVLVESGEYYENYPLRVPANTSIVGDEFRRVIFHPRPGTSSSPWAFIKFRRDPVIDGLTVATQNYGYHYLQDSTQPVYPMIDNKGGFESASILLGLNRRFLQEEIVAWMNDNIANNTAPFNSSFTYDETLCNRDVGLLVDSFIFDLKYGSYNRTVSAGLKYYQSDSASIAITTQLSQYLVVLDKLESLMLDCISNTQITNIYQNTFPQVIDAAYQAESGSATVIPLLILVLKDVIDGSGSVNYPKENNQMDVFLANDSVRWQAISAIGHGGFMGVLDPEGQILSRSPYFQECASFSKSENRQVFAGGIFADGFAGNLEFVINNIQTPTRLEVSGLDRFPQVPASFIVGDSTYRVNYIRDFVYGVGNFTYDSNKCARDIGIITNAILDDYILGTNYKHVLSGLSYLRSYTSVVTTLQKSQTISGLNYARDRILTFTTGDTAFSNFITNAFANVTNLINSVSPDGAPDYYYTLLTAPGAGVENSVNELILNKDFLVDEGIAFINSTLSPESIENYNETACRRDLGYFIDAFTYDLQYGGNTATNLTIQGYYDGTGVTILGPGEIAPTVAVFSRIQDIIGYVILANTSWIKSLGNTSIQSTAGGLGNSGTVTIVENLIQSVIDVLTNGLSSLPADVDPSFSLGINYASNATKTTVVNNLTNIENDSVLFINAAYQNGSSAVLVLDQTTPWPYNVFTYDSSACNRDVGLILDGLGYDIVFGTNYWTRVSGTAYRMSQSAVVIQDQRSITIRAIDETYRLVNIELTGYGDIQDTVSLNNATIDDIIDRGVSATPSLSFTLPPGLSTNKTNAFNLLMANRNYIVAEVDGWINAQISGNISPWATGDTYNAAKSQRDTKLIVEAVIHDLIYGGNAATRQAALKYYNNLTGASMLASGQPARCSAALQWANTVAKAVIINTAPGTTYSTLSRTTGSAASASEQIIIDNLFTAITGAISANDIDSMFALVEPNLGSYAYSTDAVTARSLIQSAKLNIQQSVIEFVNYYGNRYELIMPGNRSMLANDYTQVNDMGYGAIAANGGLLELVSVFTYYNYTSYYSITGGQIRSVGGSSAHGVYALVAEGADPLEVPTPTSTYEDLAQRVDCYYPSPSFANVTNGLLIFVTNYKYPPLGGGELEVDHDGVMYRYAITSVATNDLPPGVARLNLSSGTGGNDNGLHAVIPDGTKMTVRCNSQILLTGALGEVAVRPSTGLKLRETPDFVNRVLQFTEVQDDNAPYEILFTAGSSSISVLATITTIATNVCTTSQNHKLEVGDKFIPRTTSNGLVAGTTYYVLTVPKYNQFTLSTAPGGSTSTLTNGTGLTIKGIKTHKLIENYLVSFDSSGTLPSEVIPTVRYWVLSTDLTDTEFSVSSDKNGLAIDFASVGSGTTVYYPEGVTLTQLRENYNYIELTVFEPGEFTSDYPTGRACTIAVGVAATITLNSHGFNDDDVIRFTTDGVIGNNLPTGLTEQTRYFVVNKTTNNFQVSTEKGGTPVDTTAAGSGTFYVGKVTGRVGDDNFAVVGIASQEISRVSGSKFVFKGEEYTVSSYQPESVTNKPYARVVLDRALVDAINNFPSSYTIFSSVPIRSSGSLGTLTIRIALTRVTSHDLLEIGTGSYADTNYPKEIYGSSVNPLDPSKETVERDVGRCFYVTTDQYGNFKVGPYFAVDQGTGQVTFSSSIALSNLDGLGFKRGVPIAEFSTDSSFTDNATDTVPTENAARIYIERRLGVTHNGTNVDDSLLIPQNLTAGFMALSGQLPMKGDMNLAGYNIFNLGDPIDPTDAVNLQSLTFDNFQDVTLTTPSNGQLLGFTGTDNAAVNVTITGDVSATRTGNNLDIQYNAGSIVNADVNASAAIDQSKLNMTAASTRANATGITQADRGLSSFDSAQFTATNGWLTVKDNGLTLSKLAQLSSKTVAGNSSISTANASEVAFTTVVDGGLGIKKAQYTSTGFLRRNSGISNTSDADYSVIGSSAGSSSAVGAGEIIVRDSNGDFGGRTIDISSIKVDTQVAVDTATAGSGGYLRYYGYNSAGGVLIQDGTVASDKVTKYWNDLHQFKTQNGLSDAPITCSSIQTLALTTGAYNTNGTITGRWTLTGTSPNESRLQATYSADLAENYEGDKEYEVGTVLVFGGEKEVTTTGIKGDTRVAGVVSNTAAYTMYEACPGFKNLVALQGRVPCKVVGKIKKGDILVTSGIPGVATAAVGDVKVGTVVGKALYDYDSDHIGTLEIAVGRT